VWLGLDGTQAAEPSVSDQTPRVTVDSAVNIDQDWRLWFDDKASWQNDAIYLPEDLRLDQIPVNPPTGGRSVLTGSTGMSVSLPSTVEEHYWGHHFAREAKSTNRADIVNAEGNYLAVSWWHRPFKPPKLGVRWIPYLTSDNPGDDLRPLPDVDAGNILQLACKIGR
jgi:hypothetical protein